MWRGMPRKGRRVGTFHSREGSNLGMIQGMRPEIWRTLARFWWKASKLGVLGLLPFAAAQQPPDPSVFHSETRLVEVEVVVRDQRVRPPGLEASLAYYLDSGPPFGPAGALVKSLTKDDFTLLDQGKPQSIAVFRTSAIGEVKSITLPPGAVSNRQDSRGQPVNNATAVLMDFLNTGFDYTGYERVGLTNLLRSLAQADSRVALYTLGENLHMLHDFTDDSQSLVEIAAKLDEKHGTLPADLKSALRDYGDLLTLDQDQAAGIAAQVHTRMTVNALSLIIQHLSGVPGRKNLVWLMDDPHNVPPAVIAMVQRANIALYPVLVRTVRVGGPMPGNFADQRLAASTGGRAFFDARDLTYAVEAAEEDSHTAYVLGYYAAADMLDGKYHQITVKIHGKAPDKQPLEVHYRPGYLATKVAIPATAPTPEELYGGRVNSARIGLVGQATPDAQHPGLYNLRVTVDLHDIQLDRKDGHFTGSFDLSFLKPSAKGTVMTGSVAVNLTDEQLAKALENGFPVMVAGAEPLSGEIRVVVRDRATGTAGSLRIPAAAH
jgi:VWFA-related protein